MSVIEICCEKMLEANEEWPVEDAHGMACKPGCCGGGCYIFVDMRFCPFCGQPLTLADGSVLARDPANKLAGSAFADIRVPAAGRRII